jgi:hypothetical protein
MERVASAAAPPQEKMAASQPASAEDFGQAQLALWAEGAENSIAKRLDHLRPQAAPLADNAVFLYLFAKTVRKRLISTEKGQFLRDEFLEALARETPLSSKIIAEGMVWHLIVTPKDAPAWKSSWRSAGRATLIIGLSQFYLIYHLINIWRHLTIANFIKAVHWLILPYNALHVIAVGGVMALCIAGATRASRPMRRHHAFRFACSGVRHVLANKMGMRVLWREGRRAGQGFWMTMLVLFLGLGLGVAAAGAVFSVATLIYSDPLAWPALAWGFLTFFLASVASMARLSRWTQTDMTPDELDAQAFGWLLELTDAWRARELAEGEAAAGSG